PPTSMRPLSGRSRPMRCFRKTDLPPPLRPMMTVIEPSGTSRSTPFSTVCRPNDFRSPLTLITASSRSLGQDGSQEVVPHQDQHGGEHDGLSGGLGHALGAARHVVPLVRA